MADPGFVAAELNADADFQAGRIGALSLHTASPGTTGANETAGGAPAYARQPITWAAAGAVGPLGATAQPATPGRAWSSEASFDVKAGAYTYAGCWSAVAGTYRGGFALAASQGNPNAQSTVKVSMHVDAANLP